MNWRWPVWFPYPNAWLRTVVLCLWFVITSWILRITIVWGGILSAATDDSGFIGWGIGIGAGLSTVLFACFHSAIFAQTAKRRIGFIAVRSLWEGVFNWIVLIGSVAIALLILVPFIPIHDYAPLSYEVLRSNPTLLRQYQSWAGRFITLTLFCIPYAFHFDDLIRQYSARKTSKFPEKGTVKDAVKPTAQSSANTTRHHSPVNRHRPSPQSPSNRPLKKPPYQRRRVRRPTPPVDPIEQELNQLKRSLGLATKDKQSKPPSPSTRSPQSPKSSATPETPKNPFDDSAL